MPQTNLSLARKNASKINVTIKPSTRKHKKLDVFDRYGNKLASIGDTRYSDYLQHKDSARKARYKQRHEKDRHERGTAGYYADKILWS